LDSHTDQTADMVEVLHTWGVLGAWVLHGLHSIPFEVLEERQNLLVGVDPKSFFETEVEPGVALVELGVAVAEPGGAAVDLIRQYKMVEDPLGSAVEYTDVEVEVVAALAVVEFLGD
jgi:hypothetical protein